MSDNNEHQPVPDGNPAQASLSQILLDQLAVGGRLIVPVGAAAGEVLIVTRHASGISGRRVEAALSARTLGRDKESLV